MIGEQGGRSHGGVLRRRMGSDEGGILTELSTRLDRLIYCDSRPRRVGYL